MISDLIGKLVKLTKVSAINYTEGNHPNGINEGYETEGRLMILEVGVSAQIVENDRGLYPSIFITSVVEEIIDDNTFRTKNSIYKLKEIPEDVPVYDQFQPENSEEGYCLL